MPLFENDYLWTVQVPEMGNPGTKMGNLQQQLLCLMVHLLIPGRFIVLAERSRFLTILLCCNLQLHERADDDVTLQKIHLRERWL